MQSAFSCLVQYDDSAAHLEFKRFLYAMCLTSKSALHIFGGK